MQWRPGPNGWEAEIDKDSTAEIMDRSRKGFRRVEHHIAGEKWQSPERPS
jgi:hypothetical protein